MAKKINPLLLDPAVKKLDRAPQGWKKLEGALTAPIGWTWYWNRKSIFGGEYEAALVKDEQ